MAERSSASTDQVSASTQQTTGSATQEITASASELAGARPTSFEALVGTFRLS